MIKRILNKSSLKANIIANFIGNGWLGIISLVFVPIYLKYIGPEGYGLIGIFASLQAVLSLLDSGLSTTLNRELASLSIMPNAAAKMHNLVKTLGTVYWLVALLAGTIALILSPVLARYWVHPEHLSTSTISYAFILLSLSLVFQFPSGFYSGGLLGLQKQVMLNFIRIFFATLRSAGAVMVLIYLSKSVLVFFGWTLCITVLQAFTYKYALWFSLPKSVDKAFFDKQVLKKIWRFAAGMTAIGLTSILLTQTDQIILSKILSLEKFGYYVFAFTIGSVTYMIASPISQSYFPKFTILLAEGKIDDLKKLYHQGCQLVTLLVMPFALFLSLFSKEIIYIWTHNSTTVTNTWQITSVVSLAVSVHCLMFIPYILCLSYSQTKIALYTNIIILIVLIPSTIYAAIYFGGLGGALCWLSINLIYLIINPLLIHRLFLKGEVFNWYWQDTFKPIIGGMLILLLAKKILAYYSFGQLQQIIFLSLTGILAFIATLFSTPELRKFFIDMTLNKRQNEL